MTNRTIFFPKAVAISVSSLGLALAVTVAQAPRSYAQTQALPDAPAHVAKTNKTPQPAPDVAFSGPANIGSTAPLPPQAKAPDTADLTTELEAMKARIDQLERELKERDGEDAAAAAAHALTNASEGGSVSAVTAPTTAPVQAKLVPNTSDSAPAVAPLEARLAQNPSDSTPAAAAAPAAPTAPDPHAPAFSDWDWTWLNGNPRNKDTAFDSKFFTPEIRADITYAYDFSKPIDDTNSGSSEIFRSNEIQLEQLGVGGDFHLDNVHARFMTQFGAYSTATIRNDPSPAKGQWDIADADRYLSEAYGGYHIAGWKHGLNFDAGIFMSYIGLFSYYNFDNWAYQPSYVSSNTPWFFQGVRIQIFPTEHLKIEPWIINGWQSYGSSNSRKGLGGQIKWTPYPWMNIVSNNYGLGHDDLYITNRGRLHTDNSIEIKYYDQPTAPGISKMAFSFTGDLGCEFGPTMNTPTYSQLGVACLGNRTQSAASAGTSAPVINPKQSFIGYMLYNRVWLHKDLYGFTIGGGQINNPGRYLVLDPPINGETASSAAINAPYFTGNPGNPFVAWDATATFDYMPKEWFTWRWEYGIRRANVPYWNGHEGMTPPAYLGAPYGTNNGSPTQFACMDGSAVNPSSPANYPTTGGSIGQVTYNGLTPSAPSYVYATCGTRTTAGNDGILHGGVWFPALQRDQQYFDIDLEVKF
jgi:hypothetical protein